MKLRRTGTHRLETTEKAENERTAFVLWPDGKWRINLARTREGNTAADLRAYADYLLECAETLELIETDVEAALRGNSTAKESR